MRSPDLRTYHLACYDKRTPPRRRHETWTRIVARVNEAVQFAPAREPEAGG